MGKITDANERKVIATNLRTSEIQKAVKDALDDKRLDDLGAQLTALATQVTDGFARITTRQDITNGKVLNHQTRFAEMDGRAGYEKIIWLAITTLVGLVTFYITRT